VGAVSVVGAASMSAAAVSGGGAVGEVLAEGAGASGFTDDFSTNTLSSYTAVTNTTSRAISAGRLTLTPTSSGHTLFTRTGVSQADGTVTTVCKIVTDPGSPSQRKIGAAARVVNASNFIMAVITNSVLECYQQVSGTWGQIGSNYTVSRVTGTDYTIALSVTGTAVAVSLNGVQRITGTTSLGTAGTWGIFDQAVEYYDESENLVLDESQSSYNSLALS
jgi:hypothetical protein